MGKKRKKSSEKKLSRTQIKRLLVKDSHTYAKEFSQGIALATQNLKDMDKERKTPNKSFKAEWDSGECPRCFLKMEKGQTLFYNVDGVLSHRFHEKVEKTVDICNNCFLTLPCECEE